MAGQRLGHVSCMWAKFKEPSISGCVSTMWMSEGLFQFCGWGPLPPPQFWPRFLGKTSSSKKKKALKNYIWIDSPWALLAVSSPSLPQPKLDTQHQHTHTYTFQHVGTPSDTALTQTHSWKHRPTHTAFPRTHTHQHQTLSSLNRRRGSRQTGSDLAAGKG